jgi:hypothetical protein
MPDLRRDAFPTDVLPPGLSALPVCLGARLLIDAAAYLFKYAEEGEVAVRMAKASASPANAFAAG